MNSWERFTQGPDEFEGTPSEDRGLGSELVSGVGIVSAILGGAATLVAGTALCVGLIGAAFPVPAARYGNTMAKVETARSFQYLALDRDGLSAADAGAFVSAAGESVHDWTEPCEADAVPDSPIAARLALRCMDHTKAFEAADDGLTLEERAHIEAYLAAPGLDVLEQLARAEGLERPLDADVVSALERGEPVLSWDYPVPFYGGLRTAAYVAVAHAALLHDEGDSERAEVVLREVVSAGLVMVDDGQTLVEALVGAVIARVGAEGLEQLYERTWRQPEAEEIRKRLDLYQNRDRSRPAKQGRLGFQNDGLQQWLEILEDPESSRGLLFEAVQTGSLGMQCGSANAILFGMGDREKEALETARAHVVRSEASAALFEIAAGSVDALHEMTDWNQTPDREVFGQPIGFWGAALGVPVELSAWALGNPRIDGCYWLYASAFGF